MYTRTVKMHQFKTSVNFMFILTRVGAGHPSNCDSFREKRFALLQTNSGGHPVSQSKVNGGFLR